MFDFTGRVVAVTGAAGQIGSACSLEFARSGAKVAAIDRDDPPAQEGIVAVKADLADPGAVGDALDQAANAVGPLTFWSRAPRCTRACRSWRSPPRTSTTCTASTSGRSMLGARHVAAQMVARSAKDGVIVNLTSVSGVVADAESIAYEASKGAVTMATRGMAVALAQHGIRVVAVGPGSMAKFQELEPRDPHDLDDYERQRIPLGRLGVAKDISDAVMFLASPAASYITGTVLYVDGGGLAAW